VKASD